MVDAERRSTIQEKLLAARVQGIVVRTLGLLTTPALEANLTELGADSLDLAELAIAVEDGFGIAIGDEWMGVRTVGDVLTLVQSKGVR